MADGAHKPIENIRIGDYVWAADPTTGRIGPRKVTRLWIHQDTLISFTISEDPDGTQGLETLTTTEDHPFWNNTDQAWQEAQDLDPGDQVLTADGRLLYVQGLVSGTEHPDTAYNLTVAGLHTYHVGNSSTLVHNTNNNDCKTDGSDDSSESGDAANGGEGDSRSFRHFTDEAGARGIAGSAPSTVGESTVVGQLQFAMGQNSYLIGEGRIGVTDLGLDATPGQLNGIGVFGPKQQYAVQFTEFDAFNSEARVSGDLTSRNIFSIPGGCTIVGICTVARVR